MKNQERYINEQVVNQILKNINSLKTLVLGGNIY